MFDITKSLTGLGPGEGVDLRNNTHTFRDSASGKLVTMDLGQSDVHIDAALSNYITGYRNGEMVADKVAAPVLVANASNYFFQFQPDNALATVDGTNVAPGGDYPTIDPALSNTRYQTQGYTLGSVLPTEILANQDAPLKLQMTAMRMCMDRLSLNREIRVKTLVYTSGSWSSTYGLVLALNANQKWNGGSASDPVRNLKQIYEASLMPPTHFVISRRDWNVFTENPAVQKYVAAKIGAAPIPQANETQAWAALLDLPIPIIAEAKYKDVANSLYPYVWNGSVALLRIPPGQQVNEEDITSFKTFRWNGAGGPNLPTEFGGTVQNGWTVRAFFNPFRGPRGSQIVVVTHNDAETITGGPGGTSLVGGLITGVYA